MYKNDERVLCFHGPLLYEAKVLKNKPAPAPSEEDKKTASRSSKELLYLVHYKGWKRTWDEWVAEERLKKWNEENLKHSKELKIEALATQSRTAEAQKKSTHQNGGKDTPGTAAATAGDKGGLAAPMRSQKRLRELETEKDDHYKPNLILQVPDALKVRLVDDWEWITKDQKIVPLPPRDGATVAKILEEYRLSVPMQRPGSAEAEMFAELMTGLQNYFDKTLGTILLYKFERQQYAEIRERHGDSARMSEVYGAEHLLRLFCSMKELVSQTNMDPQAVAFLQKHLQKLMTYLAVHTELFALEYDVTAPSYARMLNLS